jgi:hypothetical protein
MYYTAKSVGFGTFVAYVNDITKLKWKRVQKAYGISGNVTLTNTMVPSSHPGRDMGHPAHICYFALLTQIP